MRHFLILLALAAGGCTCPDVSGLDQEITFRTCADPDVPLLRGSRFEISVREPSDQAVEGWSSSGPTLAVEEDDGTMLVAAEIGMAEVVATLADGTTDRLGYEVVDGATARFRDPFSALVDGLEEDVPEELVGAPTSSDPVQSLVLAPGGEAEVTVEVRESGGRIVQWSTHALTMEGTEAGDTADTWAVVEPGSLAVSQEDGDPLGSLEVVELSELADVSLEVAAWAPDRVDGDDDWIAYARAVVRASDGEPIHGAELVWSASTGTLQRWGESEEAPPDRLDIASVALTEDVTASVCVAAELETADGWIGRSIWLSPGGNSVHDDTTCGGQACGCTAAGDEAAASLLLLLLLVPRRRRHR
jgi:MYXO-CTERM domain-containing protein